MNDVNRITREEKARLDMQMKQLDLLLARLGMAINDLEKEAKQDVDDLSEAIERAHRDEEG